LKHRGIIRVEGDQGAGVKIAPQGMGGELWAATGAQVGGDAELERHLLADEAGEERGIVGGVEGVAEALGFERVERAVNGGGADGLSGMNAEAQTGAGSLGVDLDEKLGSGNALVTADADADDTTVLGWRARCWMALARTFSPSSGPKWRTASKIQ